MKCDHLFDQISFLYFILIICSLFSSQECLLVSARLIKENIELNEHLSLAIKRLETVIFIGKADHTVHFDLGMLFIRNGEIESAKSHLQKAIEVRAIKNSLFPLNNCGLRVYV